MKRVISVILVCVLTALTALTVFSADNAITNSVKSTSSRSDGSQTVGGNTGGSSCIGGGTSQGGSVSRPSELPIVNFTATYQKEYSRFAVVTEVISGGYTKDARVMVGVYKNDVFQKLLYDIKLDAGGGYDKKIRYSVVSESDNPTDFCFKCFTLGENIKPVLPMYTVTGREAMENAGAYSIALKGVVTANSVVDITGQYIADSAADAPFIRVRLTDILTDGDDSFVIPSEQIFFAGDTDAEEYLGMAVTLDAVKNADGTYKVVSIAEDTERGSTVTVPLDRFESFDGMNRLNYYENDETPTATNATLSRTVSVVYNNTVGRNLTDIFSDNGYVLSNGKCAYSGEIKLIDNDETAGYDVILVNVAAPAVVDSVSAGIILFKSTAELPNTDTLSMLDTEDNQQRVDIIKNGKKIDPSALSEWDVLSVYAASENAEYIRAEAVTDTIDGEIQSTSKSHSGKRFTINGNMYVVSQNAYGCDEASIGDRGTFYIDKYGRIAAYREKSVRNYAYVYDARIIEQDFDTYVGLRLINENGVETFTLAQNVLLCSSDGNEKVIRTKNLDINGNYKGELETLFGTDITNQVINYSLNEEGNIADIRLAGYDDRFECTVAAGEASKFDASAGKLGKYIDADSIIYFIDIYDADRCFVGSTTDLEDGVIYKVLKMYADNKADDNNIIVIDGNNSMPGKSNSLAVITEAGKDWDKDYNEIMKISYITDGKESAGIYYGR